MPPSSCSPLLAALVALLLAAACSASSNAEGSSGSDGGGEAVDDGAIVLTDDADGLTLDEPAERVVALEWTGAEDVLAVGVEPVGVADIKGYNDYVSAGPMPDGVEDVGTRQEPSMERIRALQPDLILTTSDREVSVPQLKEITPNVLVFDAFPTDRSHLETMREQFRTIATAVGRDAEAEEALDEVDEAIAAGTASLDDAGLAGTEVVYAQGEGTIEAPGFRLFTSNAQIVEISDELGLEQGWTATPEPYGFSSVTLEGLTAIPEDAWVLAIAPDFAVREFDRIYGESPVWRNLGFVREEHFRTLDEHTWTFGGPTSAVFFVEQVVAALTG